MERRACQRQRRQRQQRHRRQASPIWPWSMPTLLRQRAAAASWAWAPSSAARRLEEEQEQEEELWSRCLHRRRSRRRPLLQRQREGEAAWGALENIEVERSGGEGKREQKLESRAAFSLSAFALSLSLQAFGLFHKSISPLSSLFASAFPPPPRPYRKMQTALAQRSAHAPLSASRAASARRAPRVAVQASARPLWVPGTKAPAHLNGTLAGDRGFDPLVSWRLCFLGRIRVSFRACCVDSGRRRERIASRAGGEKPSKKFRSEDFDGL